MAKAGSRWKKNNVRYNAVQRKALGDKFVEPQGWRNGAKTAHGEPISELSRERRAKNRGEK